MREGSTYPLPQNTREKSMMGGKKPKGSMGRKKSSGSMGGRSSTAYRKR